MNGRLVVCDTNVLNVANGDTPQAEAGCIRECVEALEEIQRSGRLALDSLGLILQEYQSQRRRGSPRGVGDHFIIWAVNVQADERWCRRVQVTPVDAEKMFAEVPDDPELEGFDRDDAKFVAVAVASGENPPILNASDTDWWRFRDTLARHKVGVSFLCPELMTDRSTPGD